ncbi:FGGY-family carbohydrate kinase [[Eubacterium] cellulosolvens]
MNNSVSCVVGTDIGTTNVKTKLYTPEGKILGEAIREHQLIYPKPTWIEVEPEVLWRSVTETIQQSINQAKVSPKDVEGISISCMSPSCLPIDKDGKPLRPAFLWCDTRSIEESDWIRQNIGLEKVHQVCGNTIAPYFGGVKWLWYRRNEPKLFEKTKKILQCNSYIIHKLTGEVVIDFSQAGLCVPAFDLYKKCWSSEMCDEMGVNTDLLPDVYSSSQVVGEVSNPSAENLGLRKGIPVVAGGGDFACSTLACGVFKEGEAGQMLGTAGNLMIPVKGGPFDPRLINSVHVTENYISIGNVFAGGLVRWFRDLMTSFQKEDGIDYKMLDSRAGEIPAGSDGLIVLPHLIGGIAPLWNPFTKGVIFGLTSSHTASHIYRAILEGVAYGFFTIVEIVREAGTRIEAIIAVNGGAKSQLWRQIFADVTNLPFSYYPLGGDATMGDALLAGKGVGVINRFGVIREWLKETKKTDANPELHSKYMKYYEIYRRIYDHLRGDFESIHRITETDVTSSD